MVHKNNSHTVQIFMHVNEYTYSNTPTQSQQYQKASLLPSERVWASCPV